MCPSLSFYLEKKHSKNCNATAVMSLAPDCQHVNGKKKSIESYWLVTVNLVNGYQLGFEYPWTHDLASEKNG